MDEYGLEKYMKLNHQVLQAVWDEASGVWNVTVKNLLTGETFVDQAEVLVNGSGVLKYVLLFSKQPRGPNPPLTPFPFPFSPYRDRNTQIHAKNQEAYGTN